MHPRRGLNGRIGGWLMHRGRRYVQWGTHGVLKRYSKGIPAEPEIGARRRLHHRRSDQATIYLFRARISARIPDNRTLILPSAFSDPYSCSMTCAPYYIDGHSRVLKGTHGVLTPRQFRFGSKRSAPPTSVPGLKVPHEYHRMPLERPYIPSATCRARRR